MKSVKVLGVLAGLGVMAAGVAFVAPSPAPAASFAAAAADEHKVDPVHSSVIFKIKHMNTANFYGTFKAIEGKFSLDQADAAKSMIDVKVDAASIDTRNGARDGHVKGSDYLSVKEFKDITFKSTAVKKTGDKAFEVTGNLTFLGQTKPVTVAVTQTDDAGKGLEAKFSIKRTDFGNALGKGLSDEVELLVSLEGGGK